MSENNSKVKNEEEGNVDLDENLDLEDYITKGALTTSLQRNQSSQVAEDGYQYMVVQKEPNA